MATTTSSFDLTNHEEITSNIPLFESEVNAVYKKVKGEFDMVLSTPSTLGPPKSDAAARTYRYQGVELMSIGLCEENAKNLTLALEIITKSIALCLEDSRELALAYGDRARVFYYLKKYDLCLMDINRALKYSDYPVMTKSLLLDLHKECAIYIKQSSHIFGLDVEKKSIMREECLNETEPTDFLPEPSLRWGKSLKNPKIPNASTKIELRRNRKWGRHFVACADIDAGEILSCEKFFSFGVPPDGMFSFNYHTKKTTLSSWHELGLGRYDHCSHCAKTCKNLIPCTSCTAFMFCSEKCRSQAYQEYHRTECRMGALYWDKDAGVLYTMPYFLAVRTFLTGTKQGTTLRKLMESWTIQDIFEGKLDPVKKAFANDYKAYLKLSMTFDQNLIRLRMENAVQVVVVLRSLGFFEGISKDILRDEGQEPDRLNRVELFVVALLLNHFNTEKHYEYLKPKQHVVTPDGSAIYHSEPLIVGSLVLHALLNHACDPNADIFVSKRQHVLYARRPIVKGEQIFISYYGKGYEKPFKGGRDDELRLPFTCLCDPCTYDWPEFSVLDQDFTVKYSPGSNESSVVQILETLAAPFLKSTSCPLVPCDVRKIILNIIKVLHEHVERPAAVHQLEDILAIFMRLSDDEIFHKKDDEHIQYCNAYKTEYIPAVVDGNKMKHFTLFFRHKFLSIVGECNCEPQYV